MCLALFYRKRALNSAVVQYVQMHNLIIKAGLSYFIRRLLTWAFRSFHDQQKKKVDMGFKTEHFKKL